jgi:hypothetical protein
VKPTNFGLSVVVAQLGHPVGVDPKPFHLIGPYEKDPRRWLEMKYGSGIHRIGIAVKVRKQNGPTSGPTSKEEEKRHTGLRPMWRFQLPLLGSSRRPSPKENGRRFRTGHCPSWARTRTLLIQRGRYNQPNSSNLQPFTRVRVTRCWSLLGFMLDFAVLYSLKCRSLLK